MKAGMIRFYSGMIALAIPFIMVWLLANGHYSFNWMAGLSVIGILFEMLGLVIYFCADKIGSS